VSRLTRTARGAIIALGLALVVAAPVAAAPPTHTRYDLSPFTNPAGTACTFDVEGQPYWGFIDKTVFSDGRIQHSVRAHGAYVNPANGAVYLTADNFRALDLIDPVTNIDTVVLNGMFADSFLPGDQGPFGTVGSDPLFYDFVGTAWFTYDLNTGVTTSFRFVGTATDICAALS
jgi:hypothetical protein